MREHRAISTNNRFKSPCWLARGHVVTLLMFLGLVATVLAIHFCICNS
jgi:hypothetical protein